MTAVSEVPDVTGLKMSITSRIGTFEISSIPDQDCCQLFVPKHPATKARFSDVEADEAKLDVKELLGYGVDNATDEKFTFPVLET